MRTIHPRIVTMTMNDLKEEVQDRRESEQWNLQDCPYCGGKPDVREERGFFLIKCFKYGCREVSAASMLNASQLWNEQAFPLRSRHD